MKNINLQISDSLHKKLRLIATEKEIYMKEVYLKALNDFEKKENKKSAGTGDSQ